MMRRFGWPALGLGGLLLLIGLLAACGQPTLSFLSTTPGDPGQAAGAPATGSVTVRVAPSSGNAPSVPSAAQPVATATSASAPAGRQTATVRRGPIAESLTLTGRLTGRDEQPISLATRAPVATVDVQVGQSVEAGQVLFETDSKDIARQLDAARARLQDTQLRQQQGQARQRDAARKQAPDPALTILATADDALGSIAPDLDQLRSDDSLSPDSHKAAQHAANALASARAAVQRARAAQQQIAQAPATDEATALDEELLQRGVDEAQGQVAELENELAATRVLAPYAGVVTAVRVRPGDTVEANQPVLVLAKPGDPIVRVDLTDRDAARVAVGQSASVQPAGGDGAPLDASIASLVDSTQGGSRHAALFQVAWPAGGNPPAFGTQAQVTLTLQQADDALLVPARAVHTAGSRRYVEYLEGGTRHMAVVEVGITNDTDAQILSGLTEGQTVLLTALPA